MKKSKPWIKLLKILLNVLEVYLPAVLFMVLFLCFLIGIIFRYAFNAPQSWTFELSSICYLAVGVLSWGIAHRTDSNVVFDMLYDKLSARTQCILRAVTNLTITVVAAVLVWPSIDYIRDMAGLTAQTMPIPRGLIFVPFTVSFAIAAGRSLYRLVLDLRGLKNGDYCQKYGNEEAEQ